MDVDARRADRRRVARGRRGLGVLPPAAGAEPDRRLAQRWIARHSWPRCSRFGTAAVIEDDSAGAIAQAPPHQPRPVAAGAHRPRPQLREVARAGPAAGRTQRARRHRAAHRRAAPARPGLVEPAVAATAAGVAHASRSRSREVEHARQTYAARRAALVAELAARGVDVGGVGRDQPLDTGSGRDGRSGAAGEPRDRRGTGFAVQRPPRRPARPGDGGLVRDGFAEVAEALAAAARNTVRVPV